MEYIWSPWRYGYISSGVRRPDCVLCDVQGSGEAGREWDRRQLILYRANLNFVILNLFPYTVGHLMIVPYKHEARLSEASRDTTSEMMELAKQAQIALEAEYHPDGFNVGMNLGNAAGAGVANHLHLHIVPRWAGDANFVSVVGETRVLAEDLATTYDKLAKHFSRTK